MGENDGIFHEILNTIGEKLYIFGYGSLIWKPNFPYSRRMIGYIKGYKRRFYQSSITHRGTPKQVRMIWYYLDIVICIPQILE